MYCAGAASVGRAPVEALYKSSLQDHCFCICVECSLIDINRVMLLERSITQLSVKNRGPTVFDISMTLSSS